VHKQDSPLAGVDFETVELFAHKRAVIGLTFLIKKLNHKGT
jgi:hypothetical protein